jgi:hypothetical protein
VKIFQGIQAPGVAELPTSSGSLNEGGRSASAAMEWHLLPCLFLLNCFIDDSKPKYCDSKNLGGISNETSLDIAFI